MSGGAFTPTPKAAKRALRILHRPDRQRPYAQGVSQRDAARCRMVRRARHSRAATSSLAMEAYRCSRSARSTTKPRWGTDTFIRAVGALADSWIGPDWLWSSEHLLFTKGRRAPHFRQNSLSSGTALAHLGQYIVTSFKMKAASKLTPLKYHAERACKGRSRTTLAAADFPQSAIT